MIEEKTNLIECLNFQIGQKDTFYQKIPSFKQQLDECTKSLVEIQNKFEYIRRRESYKSILEEFKERLKKYNNE